MILTYITLYELNKVIFIIKVTYCITNTVQGKSKNPTNLIKYY